MGTSEKFSGQPGASQMSAKESDQRRYKVKIWLAAPARARAEERRRFLDGRP